MTFLILLQFKQFIDFFFSIWLDSDRFAVVAERFAALHVNEAALLNQKKKKNYNLQI